MKLVGIDYLSIEKFKSGNHAVHLALLSKGVVILEGLNLAAVPAGRYELICLPLRLRSELGDRQVGPRSQQHLVEDEAEAVDIGARVDGLARTAEQIERRLAQAQARAEELERERARLEVSLDRLSVLTWALSDARKSVTRLRRTYLRK